MRRPRFSKLTQIIYEKELKQKNMNDYWELLKSILLDGLKAIVCERELLLKHNLT